jgi:hypothetical protein
MAPKLPPAAALNDSIRNYLRRLPMPSGLWSNGESQFIGLASKKMWREIPMLYGGNFVPAENGREMKCGALGERKLEGKKSVMHA